MNKQNQGWLMPIALILLALICGSYVVGSVSDNPLVEVDRDAVMTRAMELNPSGLNEEAIEAGVESLQAEDRPVFGATATEAEDEGPTPSDDGEGDASEGEGGGINPLTTSLTSEAGQVTHTVVAGENLTVIAKQYGVTVSGIKSLNGLTSDTIYVDQELKIPGPQGEE